MKDRKQTILANHPTYKKAKPYSIAEARQRAIESQTVSDFRMVKAIELANLREKVRDKIVSDSKFMFYKRISVFNLVLAGGLGMGAVHLGIEGFRTGNKFQMGLAVLEMLVSIYIGARATRQVLRS